jgi:glycosyltransferase involved in cell wall biosynthesis
VARELVKRGHRALVMSAAGRLTPALAEAGAEHVPWPVGEKSPAILRHILPLRRFLKNQQVDILHARSRLPAWIAYAAWKSLPASSGTRFVTTVHGLHTVNPYSAIMTKGERVIAISQTVRQYILTGYPTVDPAKVQLIYRGVDPASYPRGYQPEPGWLIAWEHEYPELSGKFVIALPARITRRKGHADFLSLIATLHAHGAPMHGLVVGGADTRKQHLLAELRGQADKLGIAESITFTGDRSDLKEIMAVSNLVMSLSQKPEAFGRTVLEALSLGVPVIGYDHGGVAEILETLVPEGKIPYGDSGTLIKKTLDFIWRPRQVPPVAGFTLQAMLDDTLALYASLVR